MNWIIDVFHENCNVFQFCSVLSQNQNQNQRSSGQQASWNKAINIYPSVRPSLPQLWREQMIFQSLVVEGCCSATIRRVPASSVIRQGVKIPSEQFIQKWNSSGVIDPPDTDWKPTLRVVQLVQLQERFWFNGVNNVFSNQFGFSGLKKTSILRDDLCRAISRVYIIFAFIFVNLK